MVKLAIISFEHVHAAHYLEVLQRTPEVEIYLAEPEETRLAACGESLKGTTRFADYREMLRQTKLDGAIICSANARHHEIVLECARAGIHVLCEKPIATRLKDAYEMLAACEAQQLVLGICFPCRHSSVLSQARQILRQGGLGDLVAVKSTNHGTMPGGWFADPVLAGGGAVTDHTVHVADALRWLLGVEFTQVMARAATRLYNIPVEDVGLLSLEMNNQAFVTLDTSWSRPNKSFPLWGDVHLTLVGSKGVMELELFPWTLNYYSEAAGKHLAMARDGDLNGKMIRNFIAAIRGEESIAASGMDGIRALEVVEAAYRSIASHTVALI
jgi:predicted dehydrogenase